MSPSAKEAMGANDEEEGSNSVMEDRLVPSTPEEADMPSVEKKDSGDTSASSTTNDPTSTTSATAIVVTKQPAPSFAAVAGATTPPVPLRVKNSRRAGFREQFLQKVRM
jgi:hypothetical protein